MFDVYGLDLGSLPRTQVSDVCGLDPLMNVWVVGSIHESIGCEIYMWNYGLWGPLMKVWVVQSIHESMRYGVHTEKYEWRGLHRKGCYGVHT